jgi:FdhD protein
MKAETAPTRRVHLTRIEGAEARETEDDLAVEEPLEIRVEGKNVAVVMRTPGHDRELAAGFLYSEGILKTARDVFDITTCVAVEGETKGNVVDVGLVNPGAFDLEKLSRHVFTSSSCGICSQSSIEAVLKQRAPLEGPRLEVSAGLLLSLPAALAQQQETFRKTGGLHACALFSATGELLEVREDVGRHNALDKLVGWALLAKRLPLSDCILLLSGRASFEMVQKAHAAGIGVVAAISAPSSLAVALAQEAGMTLAGFMRGQAMNVYSGTLKS